MHIPPLRERRADILPLTRHFLSHYAITEQRRIPSLTPEAQKWLKQQEWQGNVRELENTLYRAIILCAENEINVEDLLTDDDNDTEASLDRKSAVPAILLLDEQARFKTLSMLKKEIFDAALLHCDQHATKAAKMLGIGKSTLYRFYSMNGNLTRDS